ncbi:PIG-L family deacetylase [Streptomyces olivoreticuli]|nr:PIG-L family deacetylase [Streptomyces olivoreticuli]WKK24178.1 PIG-L family deacetylase [Streptomyces olivoreticuli]
MLPAFTVRRYPVAGGHILSPHLDDGVLSCWHRMEQPDTTHVVTIFAGVPADGRLNWWDRLCGYRSSAAAMRSRRTENDRSLAGAAVKPINLDYLDRAYRPPLRDITDIADAIERETCRADHFLAAAGIGTCLRRHPDHITTREVGRELLQRGHDISFYVDLPYMLPLRDFRNWPERINCKKLQRTLGLRASVEPYELSTAQQGRKWRAVRAFSSQFKPVNVLAFGALTRPEAYRWEVIIKPTY